jgi:hypothetical protein
MEPPQNRRKEDRYDVEEIPLEGIGSIVEFSRWGLKIKKAADFKKKTPALSFTVSGLELTGEIRWEDGTFIGVRLAAPLVAPSFFIKRIKRVKETLPPAQMKISPDGPALNYKKDELLPLTIGLLLEAESPEPDIRMIGSSVNALSDLQEAEEKKEPEGEEKEEDTNRPKSCKDELIARAVDLQAREKTEVTDIFFAITILGIDQAREVILDHIHKMIFKPAGTPSGFENYEKFEILKSVVFKNLCHFFGFMDIQSEGSSLLSFETAGVEILIQESSGILDQYYKSPSRLYSEVSRVYEKAFFGMDPLQINKIYFEKSLKDFVELYNGYVLAHCILNPHYAPSEDLKITLSKNGLIFSYLAYMTFLAVKFLVERDRVSGFILVMKLRGRGIEDRKIDHFLENSVEETNTVLRDLGVRGSLQLPPLPDGSFDMDSSLGRDIRFQYLLRSFRRFGRRETRRMALRYEDPSYAHFILDRLMCTDSLDLCSKTFCVVPCRNVSEVQWYGQDFSYFDLLVFKDLHKLPAGHLNAFLRLWSSFEGQILVTFSKFELLDYTRSQFYGILKNDIVDFPSYFSNETVYRRMIDQTVNYLRPFVGDQEINSGKYLPGVYSMNHIKADILLTKEIF